MTKKRRHFTSQEKVKAVKEHLVNKTPISDICDSYGITTSHYYKWQSEFFTNGTKAFEKTSKESKVKEQKMIRLEKELNQRNEAIAFLVEDNIKVKKQHGLI